MVPENTLSQEAKINLINLKKKKNDIQGKFGIQSK